MLCARFGDFPGAAILSSAFSGSAGIINSGSNGLNVIETRDGAATISNCHILISPDFLIPGNRQCSWSPALQAAASASSGD